MHVKNKKIVQNNFDEAGLLLGYIIPSLLSINLLQCQL